MNLDDFFDLKGFNKKDANTKQIEENKIQLLINEIIKPTFEEIKNNINSRQKLHSAIIKAEKDLVYTIDNFLLVFGLKDLMNSKYGFKVVFLKKDNELHAYSQYGKFNIYNEIVRYDNNEAISINGLTKEIIENDFKKAFDKLIKQ